MPTFPLHSVEETLKQLVVDTASPAERALFAMLFPRFYDQSEWSWNDTEEKRAFQRHFESTPKVLFVQPKLPRRFGGYTLPRRRYYTVCSNDEGDDWQTLANELRAYRDPVRTGMVEVVDCGSGPGVLIVGERHVRLEKAPCLAVIIHEPARVTAQLEHVAHDRVEDADRHTTAIVRFGYQLRRLAFSRAIDLRDPATRAWFADYFSHPNEDWVWPEAMPAKPPEPAVTIRSLYDRTEGRAPRPDTFGHMLPTLLNPARGGGDSNWGGTTLMAIGEHLRNHGAEALVFPAARSDVLVGCHDGERRAFSGWNLVAFRHEDADRHANFVVFDYSPWSWIDLPGITIRAGREATESFGTLTIEGAVAQSSSNYRADVACVRAAEAAVGPWSAKPGLLEAWALGTYGLRWVHLAFAGATDRLQEAFDIGCGLLLRRDLEHLVVGMREAHARVAQTGDGEAALGDALRIASDAEGTIEPFERIGNVVGAAIDLELILLILTRLARGGNDRLASPLSGKDLAELQIEDHALRDERLDLLIQIAATQDCVVAEASSAAVRLATRLTKTDTAAPTTTQLGRLAALACARRASSYLSAAPRLRLFNHLAIAAILCPGV